MKRILIILLIVVLALPCPFVVAEESNTVTLSSDGDLNQALDQVSDGGTIQIYGRYNVPKDFEWESRGKHITFTGGTLCFTAMNDFAIGDPVTFQDIRLQFADGSNLYANGHELVIHKDVNINGLLNLYGGAKVKDVASTKMHVMAGSYLNIYGGCNNGDVLGDVELFVDGEVNKNLSISHSHDYQVFGGGNSGKIYGNVNLYFGGNARTNYVYGGCSGKNSEINGHINLQFAGGRAMSVCGGSKDVNQNCDVYLNFTGGQAEQIFGGCEKASMIGNILISVTGGKVTRRIYGGCYNNYTYDGWQSAPNYVYGKILLLLGEEAEITLLGGGGDNTLFAHSRQVTFPQKEDAHIAFTSEAAKTKYLQKIGPQDSTMKSILGKTKGYEKLHVLTYTPTRTGIAQSCSCCDTATAEITVSDGIYNGQPHENAQLVVSENWLGPEPVLTYEDNMKVGTAKARLTIGSNSVTVEYTIWPPIWVCITVVAALLIIAGGIATFVLIKNKKKASVIPENH